MLEGIRRLLGYETRSLNFGDATWLILPTKAGPPVTDQTALNSPTALACFSLLVETIAMLPLILYEREADGGRRRATEHTLYPVLHDWANPWTSSADLRRAMTGDAILRSDGFGLVIRTGGEVKEIHRLDPNGVTVEVDEITGEPKYKFRAHNNVERTYAYDEIVHIPAVLSGAGKGKPLIHYLREAIAVDLVMAECQGKLFANGARPSGVLKTKSRLNQDQADRLRASWDAIYRGGNNAGKTAILESELEFQAISLSSVDAQFLELRRLAIQEIARGFRIPSVLVGDLERATWRNLEELTRAFLTFCLMAWLDRWQNGLTRAVLTPEERKRFFLEFLLDDLVRADIAARFEAFAKAVGGPWMAPNEVRAADNRPPIKGGDELRAPLNTAPAGGPSKPPAPDNDPDDEEEEMRRAA